VASAVATTRAMPMAVSFQGLFQLCLVMFAPFARFESGEWLR
jgi:hypothetical protein